MNEIQMIIDLKKELPANIYSLGPMYGWLQWNVSKDSGQGTAYIELQKGARDMEIVKKTVFVPSCQVKSWMKPNHPMFPLVGEIELDLKLLASIVWLLPTSGIDVSFSVNLDAGNNDYHDEYSLHTDHVYIEVCTTDNQNVIHRRFMVGENTGPNCQGHTTSARTSSSWK